MTIAERDERLARDAANRLRALDPRTSFLVQAPAGSGKTELLIQRYLALLARVDAPHRVVAMTFTRKAASEMRERVIEALVGARDDTEVTTAHGRATRALAQAVLGQAEARGWSLLEHPAQLAIFTIDALSAMIARQAPLTSKLGASPRIVEKAEALYAEAARAALAHAAPDDPAWRLLLAHLDNNAQQVVQLLAGMLAKREQWLPHVVRRDPATLRAEIEGVLRAEIDAELTATLAAFEPTLLAALARCAGRAAEFLRGEGNGAALASALEKCLAQGGLPRPHHAELETWREIAGWLLLKDKVQARKTMTRNEGVPPASVDRGRAKADVTEMLAELAQRPDVVAALDLARNLPAAHFTDADWATVEALLRILPRAAAELSVVFAGRNAVDFAQLTASAVDALGESDAPSELLLRLDLAVDHLLVDEFQDTSDAQFRLIALLTSGWEPGDGRTLFAVGDPMQSIYRFRDAEVRLFLEARAGGRVGNVPVEFIDLARNFRSQAHLVAWANRLFPQILGATNEPWRGAVAFAAASATHEEGPEGPPTLEFVGSRGEEAARVVSRVQSALDAGAADVAILVRARGDLDAILPALRDAGVTFAAVELDALSTRQAVLDLVALTHSLIQPADRLAALSVLRAPWCGLVLADLFAVSAQLGQGLVSVLAARSAIDGVSDDGRARLARIAQVLEPAFADHGRAPLADRARGVWLALGGPATIEEAVDFEAAEDFFALLRTHAAGGDVDDWQALRDELSTRFVTSAEEAITKVKVMTLFRAKGLEFDTVVIPGLARTPPPDDRELLLWRARPRGLLLASLGSEDESAPSVYEYLKWLAGTEADHELGRMLYVGATRARRRLHLFGVAEVVHDPDRDTHAWKTPRSASALGKLWKVLRDEIAPPVVEPADALRPRAEPPPLRRLPVDFALPPLPETVRMLDLRASVIQPAPVFEWARADAAAVGTVTHRQLARMSRVEGGDFDSAGLAEVRPRIRADLAAEGVDPATLDKATDDVVAALSAVHGDERGRWLFDPSHGDAISEWALAGVDGGAVVHVTLDRSFVSDGVRWIVDFKTGRHEGTQTEAFLAQEVERYRDQLERYARIVRALDDRPIRLALYYPLVKGGWREWPFDLPGTQAKLF